MNILVTGSAGFIGYHLTKKLLQLGNTVTGIDNISEYYDVQLKLDRLAETGISTDCLLWNVATTSSLYPKYSFIRMNIEDNNKLNQLFETSKFDVVCNLAAQPGVRYSLDNPHAYINSNIVGFLNILEACRHNKIKHLVYASSSSVYGNSDKMPLSVNDRVDNPVSLYAATKKSNELMAYTYSHLFNIRTTGLRFFTVYGPWGRPDMAPALFANAISKGEKIKIFNHGNLERDFTYVDDIVEGIVRVITTNPMTKTDNVTKNSDETQYSIYNIGNGNPVKLMDFIESMENALNKKAVKEFLPMQPGDVLKTFADVKSLKADYNYAPNTTLNEGINHFVSWYKNYYRL